VLFSLPMGIQILKRKTPLGVPRLEPEDFCGRRSLVFERDRDEQ
jgi:hypothetical protein